MPNTSLPNTADTYGEQGTLDRLVQGSLKELVEDRLTAYSINIANSTSQWTGLRRLEFPNLPIYYAQYMPRVTHLVFKNANYRNTFSNRGLYSLMHLALTSQGTPITGQSNPLSDTLIANGLGAVYVKPEAVNSFKNDSNWGQYRIESIEDYPINLGTISDSWSEIAEACADGTYATKYAVGDTKELTVNGEYALATIVAMDADVLWDDGVTTVPTTWMTVPLPVKYYRPMNVQANDRSNWADSNLRGYMTTILNAFDPTVRQAIKQVRKTYHYKDASSGTSYTGECGDNLWVPSMRELLAADESTADSFENDGPRYTLPVYPSLTYPYARWYDGTNTYYQSWTRTQAYHNANYTYYYNFYKYSGTGNLLTGQNTCSSYQVVTVGFCI